MENKHICKKTTKTMKKQNAHIHEYIKHKTSNNN